MNSLWRHRARTADRAAAKGMMPLKPEENPWRRASFGIGNPYGTTPNCGVLTCTGILLQLVPFITLQAEHAAADLIWSAEVSQAAV